MERWILELKNRDVAFAEGLSAQDFEKIEELCDVQFSDVWKRFYSPGLPTVHIPFWSDLIEE